MQWIRATSGWRRTWIPKGNTQWRVVRDLITQRFDVELFTAGSGNSPWWAHMTSYDRLDEAKRYVERQLAS